MYSTLPPVPYLYCMCVGAQSINTYAILHKEHKVSGSPDSTATSDSRTQVRGWSALRTTHQRRSLPLPLAFLSLSLFQVTSHRSPSFSVMIALCQPLTLQVPVALPLHHRHLPDPTLPPTTSPSMAKRRETTERAASLLAAGPQSSQHSSARPRPNACMRTSRPQIGRV